MRTIAVITTSRSDYSIYLPILRKINADKNLRLHLIASGTHLVNEFGQTVDDIISDGLDIADRVEILLHSDAPEAISKSMGLGIIGFAQVLSRVKPDVLLLLGDRFEMHAAASAALPFKIPVAHIHGGELTEGAIDDSFRHSITKLSHIHFVAASEYALRVRQLGEEPWRVIVSGAPSIDNVWAVEILEPEPLGVSIGFPLDEPPLLVTYHPVTLESEHTRHQFGELLAALENLTKPIIFTMPNADTGGRAIQGMIREFVQGNPNSWALASIGTQGYFSLMAYAAAMVGNSSSGVIEASSFRLPVVNIGTRQKGRIKPNNVIDVGYDRVEISTGIEKAVGFSFRDTLKCLKNPYGSGNAAGVIVENLKNINLDDRLLMKRFVDIPSVPTELEC